MQICGAISRKRQCAIVLQISQFEKLEDSDPYSLVSVSPLTGEVINNRVLDFEVGSEIQFLVKAVAPPAQPGQPSRSSDARVRVKLEDVNDHAPAFPQELYAAEIREDALPLAEVLRLEATDVDTGVFGQVRYAVVGDGAETFTVDPEKGILMVRSRHKIPWTWAG